MDTGTHLVMGIALSGLAAIDPTVATHGATATAVVAGVMIGSQAPDIDTVLKLRNNAVYIRHHRGATHSIPAVLTWPILISVFLWFFFQEANFLHLLLWTFLAVFLHVFVDIFNAYGTQALRPFSNKWIALGVINTFDPIIFGLHVVAILLWMFGTDPVWTMLTLYGIVTIYYIIRFSVQAAVRKAVVHILPEEAEEIIVAPTMRFFQWRIAATTKTHHYVGRAYGRSITMYDKFERKELPDTPLVRAAMQDKNMAAFCSFSPINRWKITDLGNLHEVRLIDLRYRSNGYYPFVAVAHLNDDLEIVNSYTGWIFSEDKLHKKLSFLPIE